MTDISTHTEEEAEQWSEGVDAPCFCANRFFRSGFSLRDASTSKDSEPCQSTRSESFFFFGSPEGLTLALEASLFVLVQVFWMPLGNEGIRLCPGKGELLVVARVSFSRVCSTMLYREEGANGPWVCRRGETFRPRGLRLRPLVSSRG